MSGVSPIKVEKEEVPTTPTKEGKTYFDLPETPKPGPKSSSQPPTPSKGGLTLNDFEVGETLGHGSFGKVFVATRKGTDKKYAIKMLDKKFIQRQNKVHTVMNEKKVLQLLDHVAIIKLFFTFQDPHSLYYVLELCAGGELCDEIRRLGSFDLKVTKFFTAEVVKALIYMHGQGILHRDLKPENILITDNGHIKICDFGTSKILAEENVQSTPGTKKRTKSFVGTAEYVSPEVLNSGPITKAADYWALGCIIYQMLAGKPPFRGLSEFLTFQQILNRQFEFPDDFPPVAKDLVNALLVLEPSKRLGVEKDEDLMTHPFFEGIVWDTIFEQTPPPLPQTPATTRTDDGSSEVASPSPLSPSTKTTPKSPVGITSPQRVESKEELDSDEEEFTSPTKPRDAKYPEPSTPQLIAQSNDSSWSEFCLKNESLVFNGLVKKGRAIFAKKRQLILTSFPRFVYLEPAKRIQKGEIQWSNELWAEFKDQNTFILYTPGRKYYFSTLSCGAKQWVDEINKIKQAKASKETSS